MDGIGSHLLLLAVAGLLLALNGFFVAAEFALVKMRSSRIDLLVSEGRRFSKVLEWHTNRLDAALAACQLGITLASLGLGWIGEPALAGLLEKPLQQVGLGSAVVVHTVSFVIAFSLFTALHITVGEQVPKIFAIRRPEPTALFCALPLKLFYLLSYPFLIVLNASSNFLLSQLGLQTSVGHEEPHSEDEIRHLLAESRLAGELSKTEHRLMNAVFDFDELVCRQVMIPRKDIVMIDVDTGSQELFALLAETLHSRYPIYEGTSDNVVGVIHVKDLAGKSEVDQISLRDIARPIRQVPETMSIAKLLTHFQSSKVHMALMTDEYGSIVGAVTLEDVLEELVGSIQDEFDAEPEPITKEGEDAFIVLGTTPIERVNDETGLHLTHTAADTISGYIVDTLDRPPQTGDVVLLENDYKAEVLSVEGTRATSIRVSKTR